MSDTEEVMDNASGIEEVAQPVGSTFAMNQNFDMSQLWQMMQKSQEEDRKQREEDRKRQEENSKRQEEKDRKRQDEDRKQREEDRKQFLEKFDQQAEEIKQSQEDIKQSQVENNKHLLEKFGQQAVEIKQSQVEMYSRLSEDFKQSQAENNKQLLAKLDQLAENTKDLSKKLDQRAERLEAKLERSQEDCKQRSEELDRSWTASEANEDSLEDKREEGKTVTEQSATGCSANAFRMYTLIAIGNEEVREDNPEDTKIYEEEKFLGVLENAEEDNILQQQTGSLWESEEQMEISDLFSCIDNDCTSENVEQIVRNCRANDFETGDLITSDSEDYSQGGTVQTVLSCHTSEMILNDGEDVSEDIFEEEEETVNRNLEENFILPNVKTQATACRSDVVMTSNNCASRNCKPVLADWNKNERNLSDFMEFMDDDYSMFMLNVVQRIFIGEWTDKQNVFVTVDHREDPEVWICKHCACGPWDEPYTNKRRKYAAFICNWRRVKYKD